MFAGVVPRTAAASGPWNKTISSLSTTPSSPEMIKGVAITRTRRQYHHFMADTPFLVLHKALPSRRLCGHIPSRASASVLIGPTSVLNTRQPKRWSFSSSSPSSSLARSSDQFPGDSQGPAQQGDNESDDAAMATPTTTSMTGEMSSFQREHEATTVLGSAVQADLSDVTPSQQDEQARRIEIDRALRSCERNEEFRPVADVIDILLDVLPRICEMEALGYYIGRELYLRILDICREYEISDVAYQYFEHLRDSNNLTTVSSQLKRPKTKGASLLRSTRVVRLDTDLCNAFLDIYAETSDKPRLVSLLVDMKNWDIVINVTTYNALIKMATKMGDKETAMKIIQQMKEAGCEPDAKTQSILDHYK